MPSFQGKDVVDLLDKCDQILLKIIIHIFYSSLTCSSSSLYSTQASIVLTTVTINLVYSLLVSNMSFARNK
jgi:hypothetical protein